MLLAPLAPPAAADLPLLRVSRRAMATTFEVAVPYGTPDALAAATAALDLIDDLEAQLTVYRDDSEVSRLNAAAAGGAAVEPRLFDLLVRCGALTRDTAGAFDVAVGAAVKAWGFHRREGRVPPPDELAAARRASGFRHVVLDADRRFVKYLRAGLEINLGAVGKGYALDRAADLLRHRWGVRSALLHGGGSSARAVGAPPGQPRGWGVAIRHPRDDARTLGTVWLADRGFGTSAATYQFFVYKGRRYGHLLDPRTASPADGTASASVLAPTAADADALSTAFFVLGADAAVDFCRPRPELAAVVLADRADRPTVVGLTAAEYDPPGARTFDPSAMFPLDP